MDRSDHNATGRRRPDVTPARASAAAAGDPRPAVLHVLHSLERGGAEMLVRDMVQARGDRFRFVVLSLSGDGPLGDELRALGATVRHGRRRPGFDLGCAGAIAAVAREHRVDLIHAHQYSPFVYAAIARLCGAWRCRLIYTEHGRPYPDARRWKRQLANRPLRRLAHHVTAVSKSIAAALNRYEAIPADRIQLIRNGIDPEPFMHEPAATERDALRRSLGRADDDVAIIQVAGFRPIKDHATALRALAALADDRPRAKLLLVGDGPTQAPMMDLARQLKIADRTIFLGPRTDVPDLLRAADVALLSSLSEGTSVALLEAMAAARAVVATAVGGNVEVVADGRTGRLTPRGDAAAMADALRDLIDDPTGRRAMGLAGRERMLEHFTQQRMHDAFAALYQNAAARPRDRRDQAEASRPSLIVFADDFGRHPSSMQHLARHLVGDFDITWVNTVGMRRPRLCRADLHRGWQKLRQWAGDLIRSTPPAHAPARSSIQGPTQRSNDASPHDHRVRVISPVMWPSFHTRWARAVNRWLLGRTVRHIASRAPGPVSVVTSLPITADLVGMAGVDRWVYYMVDDHARWPGHDTAALVEMHHRQVDRANTLIAASRTLAEQAGRRGRTAAVLTHGLDLDRWRGPAFDSPAARRIGALPGPRAVYWGLIDGRLDREAIGRLAAAGVDVVLVGPTLGDVADLVAQPRVHLVGPVDPVDLPAIAEAADVLIMPYRTTPATQAMQPLKLTEYLATDRPAVCLELPELAEWADACDVVPGGDFVARVQRRAASGLPASQARARRRVADEDWSVKAARFAAALTADPQHTTRAAA